MKELSYSFDAEYIIKKKKSLKRQLLADVNRNFVEKRIAILGGEMNIPLRRSRLSGKMETTCPDRRKPL